MKRIAITLMTALAVLSFQSCNKTELDPDVVETPAKNTVNFSFDVKNLEGMLETKSTENNWAEGDKINLWFSLNKDYYSFRPEYVEPDLIITYNGSEWIPGEPTRDVEFTDNARLSAVYEGTNNISNFPSSSSDEFELTSTTNDYTKGFNVYPSTKFALCNSTYRYDSESNTVSADLNLSIAQNIRIVIKDDNGQMTGNPEDYYLLLREKDNTTYGPYGFTPMTGWSLQYYGTNIIQINSIGKRELVSGVQEEDGIAFYLGLYGPARENASFRFNLIQKGVETELVYDVTGKNLSTAEKNNISIKYSKFTPYINNNQAAEIQAVDLGLSVNWANMNLGAYAEADNGDYYSWGCTTPYISTQTDPDGQIYNDVDIPLKPEHDAATKYLGEGWSIPTEAQMKELMDNCTFSAETAYDSEGFNLPVIKATSKINGNSILMPCSANYHQFGYSDLMLWTSSISHFEYTLSNGEFYQSFDLNSAMTGYISRYGLTNPRIGSAGKNVLLPIRPVHTK